ncbi:1-phosphofructokinase [Oceanisphaera pacifica]|uniref:Phosphofructokinase n=1 Tax=Oceanisphaera pacifica TaxID=2818389 RepID=A0ABS3NI72_9GAMM|nr:1-phosphofructokinase [Oceanisphaera pacifica]MBO1520235.1 1-phosphofructokinase [Oceanisphaera pacifica]
MSIVTVTLNPALDLSVTIPSLQKNQVNIATNQHLGPAGKGINVARVLSDLGHTPIVTGFLGRDNAAPFTQLFSEQGIRDHCLRLAGNTRINTKISEGDGSVTDINTPGLAVTKAAWSKLCLQLNALVDEVEVLVISGSVPPGVSLAQFSALIAWGRQHNKAVILDSSHAALEAGIKARPSLIKPNIDELSTLMGRTLSHEPDIMAAAGQLQQQGIAHVVVSMGAQGVYWFTPTQCWHAQVPKVDVVSTVGAGDSLVAGLSVGLVHSDTSFFDPESILRRATALSLLAVTQVGVGIYSSQQYADYQAAITITERAARRV